MGMGRTEKHLKDSPNPQGYWEHGWFAIWHSLQMIFYALLGIVHGICPVLFPFATSSALIRFYDKLVKSRRHDDEILEIQGREYIRAANRHRKASP